MDLPVPVVCRYILPDGAICNDPQVVSRGYCKRHYMVLSRAKAFTDTRVRRENPKTLDVNVRAAKRAKRKLHKNAPKYADLHFTAAQEAAKKGDTRPIEWALLHTRTIDPVVDTTKANNQTIVQVGVKFAGMPRDDDK